MRALDALVSTRLYENLNYLLQERFWRVPQLLSSCTKLLANLSSRTPSARNNDLVRSGLLDGLFCVLNESICNLPAEQHIVENVRFG